MQYHSPTSFNEAVAISNSSSGLVKYLAGGTDENALNAIYNLADIINKIAFGLVIWAAAKSESAKA